jgi:hypothetical protein
MVVRGRDVLRLHRLHGVALVLALVAVACLEREMSKPERTDRWPDPTPEMLADPHFEAVWQCIRWWDIGVPMVYRGYCAATGNHVRAILDALAKAQK